MGIFLLVCRDRRNQHEKPYPKQKAGEGAGPKEDPEEKKKKEDEAPRSDGEVHQRILFPGIVEGFERYPLAKHVVQDRFEYDEKTKKDVKIPNQSKQEGIRKVIFEVRNAKFFNHAKRRFAHRLLTQVLVHRKDGDIDVFIVKARDKKMLTVKQWRDGFDSNSDYSNDYSPKKEEGMGDVDSKEGNNGDSKEPKKDQAGQM